MPCNLSLHRFIAAWVSMAWVLSPVGLAQSPRDKSIDWADLPSHRYLPPPTEARSILDQVKLLEKLNQRVGQSPDQSPLDLSPQQLKTLESLLENFRNEKGEVELPDPNSIPKQWIDNLLPDPKQREKAKQMLEQFARDQKLPLTDSSGGPGTAPQPGQRGPEQSAQPNKTRNNSSPDRSNDEPKGERRSNTNLSQDASRPNIESPNAPSTDQPLPGGIPQQYRELFDKLKQFEKENRRSLEANAPWQQQPQAGTNNPFVRGDQDRTAPGMNRSNDSTTKPGNNPTAANKRNARTKVRENPNAPKPGNNQASAGVRSNGAPGNRNPFQSPGNGLRPNGSRLDSNPLDVPNPNFPANNAIVAGDSSSGNSSKTPSSPQPSGTETTPATGKTSGSEERAKLAQEDASVQGPVPEVADSDNPLLSEFKAPPKAGQDEALTPALDATSTEMTSRNENSNRISSGFNVTRLADEARSNRPDRSADLRRSLEQSGLAQSLKRIVQDTIKDQQVQRAKEARKQNEQNSNLANNPSTPKTLEDLLRSAHSEKDGKPETAARTPALPPGPAPGPGSTGSNNRTNSSNNNSWSSSPSPSTERWARWASEIWKSVSVVPEDSGRRTSASSSNNRAGASWTTPEFRWTNSMTIVLLVTAVLVGVLVWLSRRHITELTTASQKKHAEWVRSVLSEGLKTRADVIRAFHRLVRRSQPVADWWTHRLVVRYFSQQTPQYAAAMNELAGVYEQARYYPEDADLSPQQLEQVRRIVESLSQI